MSNGPASLWRGVVPHALRHNRERLETHLKAVIGATPTDSNDLVRQMVEIYEEDGESDMAYEVAVLLAGQDRFENEYGRPSHRALGWLVLAARDEQTPRKILTLAHLLELHGKLRIDDGRPPQLDAESLWLLWTSHRCSWRSTAANDVRDFYQKALHTPPKAGELAELIGQLADFDDAAYFLPIEPFLQASKPPEHEKTALPDTPHLTVVEAIGDAESTEGRRMARTYKPLLQPMPLGRSEAAPDTARDLLTGWFPWMSDVVDEIYSDLLWQTVVGRPWLRLTPLLLEGPPGCGKSYFAEKMASLLGTQLCRIDVGGNSDNRLLAGTARGWSGSQPAFPVQAIARTGLANPTMLVDEVDKATASQNGNIHATLLGMLDAKTASQWPDECLMAPCNLSQISWVLTANDASRLPKALLSRVRRVRVQPPGKRHADAALATLATDLRVTMDWPAEKALPVPDVVWGELRDGLHRGVDLRRLQGVLMRVVAGWVRRPQTVH